MMRRRSVGFAGLALLFFVLVSTASAIDLAQLRIPTLTRSVVIGGMTYTIGNPKQSASQNLPCDASREEALAFVDFAAHDQILRGLEGLYTTGQISESQFDRMWGSLFAEVPTRIGSNSTLRSDIINDFPYPMTTADAGIAPAFPDTRKQLVLATLFGLRLYMDVIAPRERLPADKQTPGHICVGYADPTLTIEMAYAFRRAAYLGALAIGYEAPGAYEAAH